MQKVKFFLEEKYDYLFALLILVLPFSNGLPNVVMGLLLLIALMSSRKETFISYIKTPFVLLGFLMFYLYVQAILNQSFLQDIEFYKKYSYLIIVPILILKVKNIQLLKLVAIITINLTILISCYRIAKFYYYFNFMPFADGWATNAVLVLERPYAGIFCIICAILSFDQILQKTRNKYLYIASFIISISFIFFISIRISIITLLLLFFIYILFYLKISWKNKFFLFLGIIAVFLTVFLVNKNLSNRFFLDKNINTVVQKTKDFEPRFVIWGCAKEITNEDNFSILFGTDSYSNIKSSLANCYSESITDYSRRAFFLEQSFNTHNQFLDLYIIGGIIAVLLLIIFLIKSIYFNYKDFCSVAMIISFIMILIIENIFHRQFGCFIFTIFTALYINKNQMKENE